jgi:hypothetical protein
MNFGLSYPDWMEAVKKRGRTGQVSALFKPYVLGKNLNL